MKLEHLFIAEARIKAEGALALVMDAHKELGISHNWGPKHHLSSETVENAVKMMNAALSKEGMGSLNSPAWPLEKVATGFKKLGDRDIGNIYSGLAQLDGLDGFMSAENLKKLKDSAATIASRQDGMSSYANALLSTMRAILEIHTVATRTQDEYRRSIATAVLKKLGLKYEGK